MSDPTARICIRCGDKIKLQLYCGPCRSSEIDNLIGENEQLRSDLHQWTEWSDKAKARYERIVAKLGRLKEGVEREAKDCASQPKVPGAGGSG